MACFLLKPLAGSHEMMPSDITLAKAPFGVRLALHGIKKHYPSIVANDGIDLTVEAGQIHAVLGENGAGKSTLMKIVYGVVQPDAGEITWEGRPVVLPHAKWGMRATGGTLKFRRSNSSRRICQTRPITKPSASAAKISKAITTVKLIGLSPLGQGHHPGTQGLLNPFWQTLAERALGGDGGGPLCEDVVDIG
jgi:hypothetical protein